MCAKGKRKVTSRREAVAAEIPRLRRYARALLGDDGEADDLIQDTLERALARLPQWRDGDSPRKWLTVTLAGMCWAIFLIGHVVNNVRGFGS